ncbi:MAG: sulfatase [Planctomycetota bacterium]
MHLALTRLAHPLTVALCAGLCACGPGDRPRTILVVSLDTSRADAVSFGDSEITPRLAQIAARGTVFEQAVSGSSWTLPSHAQMFTGQPPGLHAVLDDDVALDPNTPILPELLSDAGFFTAGVYSGIYLARQFGFDRGFDEYVNAIEGGAELEAFFADQARRGELAAGQAWNSFDIQSHRDISSPRIVEQASKLVKAARGEDLLLFTHFFDPHYDYVPPSPYAERFDGDYQGDLTGEDFYTNPRIFDAEQRPLELPPRDLQHIQALYLGEMAWTDEHVGQLFDVLRQNDRLDDAWIFVVGDHGEEFFEHGSWGHRATLYEEQLRIPFLVVPPVDAGYEPPRISTTQITLSDLLPTILDALGLPPSEHAFGRSLIPELRGEALPPRPALSSLRSRPITTLDTEQAAVEHVLVDSLRTPEEKLIRRVRVVEGAPTVEELRWYDLAADPFELRPVGDPEDTRVRAAYDRLESEYAQLNTFYDRLPHAADEARSTVGQKWFSSQLEMLGYLDGDEGDDEGFSLTLPWGLRPLPPIPLER